MSEHLGRIQAWHGSAEAGTQAPFHAGYVGGTGAPRPRDDYARSTSSGGGGLVPAVYDLRDVAFPKRGVIETAIGKLVTRRLRTPIRLTVELDDGGFIARSIDLPIYGYGEDIAEATDALRRELEALYGELNQDDNFTEEWLAAKAYLNDLVIA